MNVRTDQGGWMFEKDREESFQGSGSEEENRKQIQATTMHVFGGGYKRYLYIPNILFSLHFSRVLSSF